MNNSPHPIKRGQPQRKSHPQSQINKRPDSTIYRSPVNPKGRTQYNYNQTHQIPRQRTDVKRVPRNINNNNHPPYHSNSGSCFNANRDLFHLLFIAIGILLICIAALITITSDCKGDATGAGVQNDIPANTQSSALLSETEDMGKSYIDSMIFVGDSNTAHFVGFGILNGGKDTKQVWVPKGSTITLDSEITNKTVNYPETNEFLTIPQAAAKKAPEYLVISLGTNGISYLSEEQFKYCYKKLIDAVQAASPNTKIIVQSIYPVTSWYTKISNDKINLANTWLLALAEECNIKYANTASVLKDSNGFLKEEYNSYHKDGYHINKDAAEKILLYLRTHGYN